MNRKIWRYVGKTGYSDKDQILQGLNKKIL